MASQNGSATTAPDMSKLNSSSPALYDEDDDIDDAPNLSEEEEDLNHYHFSKCCYNLPEWAQFLLYSFFGSLLLLAPLIVIVCLDPRPDFLDPNPTNPPHIMFVKPYVARWSLFLTLCWISELIIWRIIGALPIIITSTVYFFTKKSNEKLQLLAEFIVALRLWATWALWMIVIQALYTVFFQNNVPVGTLPTDVAVNNQYTLLGAIITTIMVFSIVVFIQKFFMHSIAVNFHRSAYAARIDRSKKCVKYMDRLRKSLKRFHIKLSPTSRTAFFTNDEKNSLKKIPEMMEVSNEKHADSPEKSQTHIEIMTVSDGKVSKKATYKSWKSFFPSVAPISVLPSIQMAGSLDVANDRQAKKFAIQLFNSMKKRDGEELHLLDFEKFFEKQVAKEVYGMFDTDMNGSVTLYELKKGVVEIYRERRSIFRSLQGFAKSFSKLENVFWIVSALITGLIVLPTWGIPLTAILPLTSVFIALGIIVGGALRTMFDCIIFLFAYHPYDAGDRVVIDGDYMIVDTFELLTTSFIKGDGSVLIAPNAMLANKMIHNIRRSGDQSEGIDLIVDFYTPQEILNELHRRMIAYVKMQTRELFPTCDFTVLEIEQLNSLKCKFIIKHKGNWQDMKAKGQRRRDFMFELIKNLKDLDISYSNPSSKVEGLHQTRERKEIPFQKSEPDIQEQSDNL